MNWRAWMTYSPNALAAEPGVPLSAPTSPESAPTMGADDVGLLHDRADLPRVHGRASSPRRREVRGAFTRWTGKHLPELVLAQAAPAEMTGRQGRLGAWSLQVGPSNSDPAFG